MFGAGYFGKGYFGAGYFGGGFSVAAVASLMRREFGGIVHRILRGRF